jgi:hypothetical protein
LAAQILGPLCQRTSVPDDPPAAHKAILALRPIGGPAEFDLIASAACCSIRHELEIEAMAAK